MPNTHIGRDQINDHIAKWHALQSSSFLLNMTISCFYSHVFPRSKISNIFVLADGMAVTYHRGKGQLPPCCQCRTTMQKGIYLRKEQQCNTYSKGPNVELISTFFSLTNVGHCKFMICINIADIADDVIHVYLKDVRFFVSRDISYSIS